MANSLGGKVPLIGAGLATLLVIGAVLFYLLGPGSGYRELQASREAVRAAKSWRFAAQIPLDTSTTVIVKTRDVVCPTDFAESSRELDNLDRFKGHAFIRGINYDRLPDGSWRYYPANLPPLRECGKGPIVEGTFLYGTLDRVASMGEIRRGDRFTTEHGACRWWDVIPERGAPPSYSVCLEGFSHLPLELRYPLSGNTYTFWDWNATTLTPPNYNPQSNP